MRIRVKACAALLLAAGLATGAAGQSTPAPGADDIVGTTNAATADVLRDLAAQPAAERRRRFDALVAEHPDDVVLRYYRLQAEDELADFAGMLEDSESILAHPDLRRRMRQLALGWRAEALIQARRFPEATAAANEALAIDGSDFGALFSRGWARYLADESLTDAALADFDRALELDPDEGIGYSRRAAIHRKQGHLDLAALDFERAVRLVPDDLPTRLHYGGMLIDKQDFEGALTQFDAAVRLKPGDPSPWVEREHAHLLLKRFDDVVADAHEAFKLGPADDDLANAHSFLASALWNKSDFAGAAREFQSVVALSDDHRIARSLGLMQWYSGQVPQAIKTFRDQAAWPDSNPYTLLWLFILQVQSNPAAETAASAELAARATPHQPHAWGDTLVELMLGRTRIDAAQAEADTADTWALRAGHRCEADYYAAKRLLLHGQVELASGLLEEAYWVCPSTYSEANAVELERRGLAARSTAR